MLTSGSAWWTAQSLGSVSPKSHSGAAEAEVVTPVTLGPVAPPAVPALPAGSPHWAAQLHTALASITTQLHRVNGAQQAWNALPASRRSQPPVEVAALHTQRTHLLSQQTSLLDSLQLWGQLNSTRVALAKTDAQLMDLKPQSGRPNLSHRGADQVGAQRTTTAQYATLLSRAQSQRRAVLSLIPMIHDEMASPVPAVDKAAVPVVTAVLAVVHGRSTPSAATNSHQSRIEAAAGPATQLETGTAPPSGSPQPPAPPVTRASQPPSNSQEQLAEAQRMTREATRSAQQLLASLGGR